MYKISHPGGIKKKKQIYLEPDFFIKGLGDYKTSKEMREMMIQGGLNKDFISDRDIEEGTKKEKDKLDKLGDTYEKRKKLEDLLNQIRRFMKDENGKIENLKIYRIIEIKKIENDIKNLITRINEYINIKTENDIRDLINRINEYINIKIENDIRDLITRINEYINTKKQELYDRT